MKAAVISCTLLLCLFSLGTAQVSLGTCGDEDSLVTCSFFFQRVNTAFRQESVLYTLRKAFFPTEGSPPFLFDVQMTLNVESVPNIACKSEEYPFRGRPVTSPPTMMEVCEHSVYNCSGIPQPWSWTHQWSKTIVSYIIQREDLELLQNTNFAAHAAATFNNFDTSVFSNDDLGLEEQNATDDDDDDDDDANASVGATRDEAVEFQLTIPYLPCIPDERVMRDAWEDILPWVSRSEQQPREGRRKSTAAVAAVAAAPRRAICIAAHCTCTHTRIQSLQCSACAIVNSKNTQLLQCCLL